MTDAPATTGLHHVTNICTDMEETVEFSEDALDWHTVKRTQNYDDPGTFHYYFSSTPEGEPGPGASYHFAFGVEEKDLGTEEIDPFGGR